MSLFTLLLILAIVLFLLACPSQLFPRAKGYFLPLGLACFAAAFLFRGVVLG